MSEEGDVGCFDTARDGRARHGIAGTRRVVALAIT